MASNYWKGREGTYHILDGIHYHFPQTPAELVKSMVDYEDIRPDDVIIMGYPKAGNHLAADIVRKLKNKGDITKAVKETCDVFLDYVMPDFFCYNPDTHTPRSLEEISQLKSPRVMNTHLHYHLLPRKAQSGQCKIIYISRDPRDVAVSWFNIEEKVIEILKGQGIFLSVEWSDYVREFISGSVVYGSWYSHMKSFLEVRDRSHILWIKFEDLKANLREEVKRIQDFLGENLKDEVITSISESCEIAAAKKQFPSSLFIDKGSVGGWKERFTVEESEALGSKIRNEMMGFEQELSIYLK